MGNLADIKYRMKGVSDTRQITKAMETVSIAKMRKAMQVFKSNAEFFSKIRETMRDIAYHTGNIDNEYFKNRKSGRALFVVIASDKGLCGSYNHNVLEVAKQEYEKFDKEKTTIFTVGHIATTFFEKLGKVPDVEYMHISTKSMQRDAQKVVENILALYDLSLIDEVYTVYTVIDSHGVTKPDVLQLLPLQQEKIIDKNQKITAAQEDYFRELEYDPSPESVLSILVKQYLQGVVYGAMVQSNAAEHSCRRSAMSNATNNAQDILDKLNLEYNRERQATVTNEILEIITASNIVTKN
ncbi:MAG: ATP synthase F1 subunit gamma [Firmicutes bacterium]|nr:ATP synthase F1 subunit gamma [Bacillota bacterium]